MAYECSFSIILIQLVLVRFFFFFWFFWAEKLIYFFACVSRCTKDQIVEAVQRAVEAQPFRLAVFDHIPSNYGDSLHLARLLFFNAKHPTKTHPSSHQSNQRITIIQSVLLLSFFPPQDSQCPCRGWLRCVVSTGLRCSSMAHTACSPWYARGAQHG